MPRAVDENAEKYSRILPRQGAKFLDLVRDEFLGNKIAALCVRYHYRGFVGEAGVDFIRLDHASSVEVSGRAMQKTPETEDDIGGSIYIKADAIELWWQPNWVNAPIEGEPEEYVLPPQPAKPRTFVEVMQQEFLGKKMAALCVRYHYRGFLAAVYEDCLILSNSASVEVSGKSKSEKPENEDPIGTFITVRTDAIEIAWQPAWVEAPLPGEDGYSPNER